MHDPKHCTKRDSNERLKKCVCASWWSWNGLYLAKSKVLPYCSSGNISNHPDTEGWIQQSFHRKKIPHCIIKEGKASNRKYDNVKLYLYTDKVQIKVKDYLLNGVFKELRII